MSATPNFDHLAAPYRWMEYLSFGPLLMRTRHAFLPQLKTARRALVLGDGDGRFTRALLNANPTILVDAIDISPAMLHALERRASPHLDRLHTICADLRTWSPLCHSYDLVITHFFLDCLTDAEITALLLRIKPALAPQARWVISEFAIPIHSTFVAIFARLLVRFLYLAFHLLAGLDTRKLPDHGTTLEQAGFLLKERRCMLGGILIADLWQIDVEP
jgi:SAM-dependent methyltransferase